ncbi:protein MIS12 homolog [Micropterus salmoides]|uniref:protein MIS12 homolog n=1 Tax=Micropterus salmoides TaxID=27706 RepID=UPI0018EA7FA4|nr:protein MIS12 homolog [Micropterus salmoides]XP_045888546.1 protein MIS12 homolog [Micropterus dolomieu]
MARETREETKMETVGEVAEEADTLKLYETQFFGFTPQTCMLRVYSAFQDCLYDILPVVEKVCVRQLSRGESDGAEELLRSRARECSRKLQQFLEERFKPLSERMEALLVSRCLSVPPNVLLPEDQAHKTCPPDIQEVLRLESSLADLQRSYEAEVCARQALLAELEEQKEVQKQLDGILMWVRELQAAWVKEGNGSFHESFRLVMESVKKLQEAVGEVCNKAPH